MEFARPLLLLLLALLPYFVYLGRPAGHFGRGRLWAALALRSLIVLLLVLSLAGVRTVRGGDDLDVVFIVDVSDSVPHAEQDRALGFVAEALAAMGPRDTAALILFGADALVERPLTDSQQLATAASTPRTHQTDLEQAMRLGLALFHGGAARRMIVLSDGRSTTGDAEVAARLAAWQGVQVSAVPLGACPAQEVWLSSLDLPTRVREGEQLTLSVAVESTVATEAVLTVLFEDRVVAEEIVRLNPGRSRFAVPLVAAEPGFASYRVLLESRADSYPQNNTLSGFTIVEGPPSVLVVEGDVAAALALKRALGAAGLDVTSVPPSRMPSDTPALARYAAVLLVNVPARSFSPGTMEAVQSFVRDLGGGLVAVGGPQAFGVGGWYETALEETLPVEMTIRDPERFPPMSIVVVIDKSGSMAAHEGGVPKIRLAGEAAARVAELINELDEIAVVAFDDRPADVIGPLPGSRRAEVIDQVIRLQAGGGGIYVRESLESALDLLSGSENPVRHIILLADGSDSEHQEGVPRLVKEKIAGGNITLSSIAIGAGQDLGFLEEIASLGGGRYYFTDRAANLPVIFAQETQLTMRTYVVEEPFVPRRRATSPMLIGVEALPQLAGYVATSPKSTAQVVLSTHHDDPLLAAWQYGLGRAVAWTSDATGNWAEEWIGWEGFARFWAQVVGWSIGQRSDVPLEAAVTLEGQTAHITVDAFDEQGEFVDGLDTLASVVGPEGQAVRVHLAQTAPGRYEGAFEPQTEGAYLLRLSASLAGGEAIALTTGWVMSYSPEYAALEADPDFLRYLAELGRGELLEEPADAFAHTVRGEGTARDLWPLLLGLATLLLPFDIGVRRLALSRRDMRQAWRWVLAHLPRRGTPSGVPAPSPLDRLFEAKARAARPDLPDVPPAPRDLPAAPPRATGPAAPRPTTRATAEEETLAGRLLRQKKEREEQET